ncbi:MAG: CoA-binding protein, partial [Desulfosarcina sp.]
MGIDRLENIFHPKSIAVVGGSERPGSIGRALMHNLIDADFVGPIHPINGKHASVMGKKAYASLSEIDDPIDLVVVATPMETVPEIVAECCQIGAAGAVIISAGGKETGPAGRDLEDRILDVASESGLRIIGPNCLGIMCGAARLNASFAARMPLDGRLAFISQSGAICAAVLDLSVK